MFTHWLYLLLAVLGVHNLLNNPKFNEETASTAGGKVPVRSKLMCNLWFGELGSLQVLLVGEKPADWAVSVSRLLSCRLWRWILSAHQGSLGFKHSNQNTVAVNGSSVWQYNWYQSVCFAKNITPLVGLFGKKIKLLMKGLHSQHRMPIEFPVLMMF